jgi:DNA-binding MarR family transcriptional regulator
MRTNDPSQPAGAVSPVLDQYTGYLLRRAYGRARDCAQQVFPPGTHPGEGAILTRLAEGGPASQQELSERLHVNRTIMVKLVDKLEAAGLVRRERNPRDRRSYALVVTPRGHQTLKAWGPAADRGEAQLTAALDPGEHQRLNHLLRQLLPEVVASMPPSLTDRTGFLLTFAHDRMRQRGERALAPLGIEPRHFGALAILDASGPSPQQHLARQLGLSGPAIVQLVDELEQAGLVERRRNPSDRRQYALRLTDAGRARLRRAREAADAVQAEVAAQLGEAGDRELRALLRKLLTAPPVPVARPRRGRDEEPVG